MLASPVRVAIVDLLADQERIVHQLVAAAGVAQPLVSQHLKVLRDARGAAGPKAAGDGVRAA